MITQEDRRKAATAALTDESVKRGADSFRENLIQRGSGKVPDDKRVTPEDRAIYRAQTPKANEATLGKDENGFFCYTHRARSKSHPTPKIPIKEITFIASTG